MIIDTHTHLYLEQFEEDIEEVVQRAKEEGVSKALFPAIDQSTYEDMMALNGKYDDFFAPMIGLHPCSVKENWQEELSFVKKQLKKGGFVAIGEIGMDLYWDKQFKEAQKEAFKIQCEWAKEYELPIAIHTRDAFDEIFQLLDEVNDNRLKGVFHCFSGNKEQMEKALSYDDFYLGIGGVVTFKNAGLDKVVKHAPLDRLMVETDAPYLTPAPYRGKRNETAYIKYVVGKLAEIFEVDVERMSEITTKNAKQLFQL